FPSRTLQGALIREEFTDRRGPNYASKQACRKYTFGLHPIMNGCDLLVSIATLCARSRLPSIGFVDYDSVMAFKRSPVRSRLAPQNLAGFVVLNSGFWLHGCICKHAGVCMLGSA